MYKKYQDIGKLYPLICKNKALNIMKISILLLLFGIFSVSATGYSQEARVSITVNNTTINEVFTEIKAQTNYSFWFDVKDVDIDRKVSIHVENETVKSVLSTILKGQDLGFELKGNHIIIVKKEILNQSAGAGLPQQNKKISGVIKDEHGEPIIGANVVVKGSTIGNISDHEGRFTLEVPENSTLTVSYIGYLPQEIKVGKRNIFNIILAEDSENLDEIVVIGYGTMKKSDLTGAVSSVKGDKISAIASTDITDILQGKVAGMNITSSSKVDESGSIRIRGNRSLNASNDPLVIVDGVPGRMEAVNTNDIESIEVLKDAANTAIYGSRGANGVILITTKKAKEQQTRISYSGYIGISVPNLVKMQSGDEYIQFRRDGYRYRNGWDQPFTDEDVFEPAELAVIKSRDFTDWIDLLYRNGQTQSHYIGLSAGNKTTKLHLGLNYTKDEGYSKINFKDKYNITLNLDHEINKYVSVGLSARLQRNNSQGMTKFEEKLQYMTPLAKPYNEDGSLNYYPAPQNTSGYNVLANYGKDNYTNEFIKNAAYLTGYINIRFSKYLNNRANISYNIIDRKNGYFFGENSYERKGTVPLAGKKYQDEVEYTFNDILSYDKDFGEHHLILDGVFEATGYTKETELRKTYAKHTRELKKAYNYLKQKKGKQIFEQIAFKNIEAFYEEACRANEQLMSEAFDERLMMAAQNMELSHGSYTYHNVLLNGKNTYIVNFDRYKNECQINDLYQFIRKVMEKYNWDSRMFYRLVDEYDRICPLSDEEMGLLMVLLSYPEKFWKIINQYINANKSWIPEKNVEKLRKVIEQNGRKRELIDKICCVW